MELRGRERGRGREREGERGGLTGGQPGFQRVMSLVSSPFAFCVSEGLVSLRGRGGGTEGARGKNCKRQHQPALQSRTGQCEAAVETEPEKAQREKKSSGGNVQFTPLPVDATPIDRPAERQPLSVDWEVSNWEVYLRNMQVGHLWDRFLRSLVM